MQAFDWSRVWEGDNVLVELTRQERALLLQHASNVLNSPSTFLTGYDEETDLEAINDFLMLLQYHLLDNPPISAVDMEHLDLFSVNAGLLSGAGSLTYNASASLPFGYSMSQQNVANYGMEHFVWLKAGEYDYIGQASLSTNGGKTDVAIVTGVALIATIIDGVSQNGAFHTRVKHTGFFEIPEDGLYRLIVADDGSQANHVCNWTSHHIRRTS